MDKVLWITTLLRKDAFNLIKTFVLDYIANCKLNGECTSKMKDETVELFRTLEGFKKGIN